MDLRSRIELVLGDRYAIRRELGSGGMAVVYLAEDRRHRRQVAIKVLRPEIASTVAHERFLREIQISAQLTHPHIVPLIESGETDGTVYYVMPYVDGESLRARLLREGALPVPDAVRILRDVADALAYAHGRGVVHRDVKPDNVILSGRHALVTDFGVARALREASGFQHLTASGIAIGTPAYMAPEQAAGLDVDHRADLYALGALGYELLTGRAPFVGASAQDVLAKHVTEKAPPLAARRPDIPGSLNALIMKCLEKRPADRWDSAETLVTQLEVLATPSRGIGTTVARAGRELFRTPARGLVAGVLVLSAAAALTLRIGGARPAAAPVYRQLTFVGDVHFASVSPDGRMLAYLTGMPLLGGKLMLQDLVGGSVLELADLRSLRLIEWRRDGAQLLLSGCYRTPIPCGRATFLLSPLGGTPQALRFGTGRHPMWSPDGTHVLNWAYGEKYVFVDNITTGERRPVPIAGSFHLMMGADWSPNGEVIAFATLDSVGNYGLHTVSADGTDQRTLLVAPGRVEFIRWSARANAIYYLQGGLQDYQLGAELRKVRVSPDGRTVRGDPETVLTGLQVTQLSFEQPAFSLTADGKRLAYNRFNTRANLWLLTPRPGRRDDTLSLQQLTTGTAVRTFPRVSPDRRWIAFLEMGATGTDIWKVPVAGGIPTRITFLGNAAGQPAWSPDGTQIAFGARYGREFKVAVVSAAGGPPRVYARTRLGEGGGISWAPGARIAYQLAGNRGLHLLDPSTEAEEALVPRDTLPWTFHLRYSPDGRLIALFENRDLATTGVWVRSVVDSSARPLVTRGFWRPLGWSQDGVHVFVTAGGTRDILRAPAAGGQATLAARLPFPGYEIAWGGCDVLWSSDTWRLICSREERTADVWMVENFDPDIR